MALQTRAPTSDAGIVGTWTGTADLRYAEVDDYPDTTTGLTVSTVGSLQFGFSPFSVPAGSTITMVRVRSFVRRDGIGGASFSGRLRTGVANNHTATAVTPLNAAPQEFVDEWPVNPFTGLAWTAEQVNRTAATEENLTAFGLGSTDANPTVTTTSTQIEVEFTPPDNIGSAAGAGLAQAAGAATAATQGSASGSANASASGANGSVVGGPLIDILSLDGLLTLTRGNVGVVSAQEAGEGTQALFRGNTGVVSDVLAPGGDGDFEGIDLAPAGPQPTLSAVLATSIGSTSFRPRLTITFPA